MIVVRFVSATALAVIAVAPPLPAQFEFAAPVRLSAGDKLLGHGRLYPSPMCHDVDGDGRLDVLVGDLRGRITFALRQADGSFGKEQKLLDAAGKDVDFHNW